MTMTLLPQGVREGEQVELLAQTPGPIRCKVGAAGGGAFAPTYLEVPMDDDAVFNGDGSGGALQLGPITVITNATDFGGAFVWDFQTGHGEQNGWIAIIAIDDALGGSVEVRTNNLPIGAGVTLSFANAPDSNPLGTYFALYKFSGGQWTPLANSFANPT